jgi:invasion protein IalB
MVNGMKLPRLLRFGLLCLAFGAGAAIAQTQEPTPLGESGDWAAYSYETAGGKVCYVVSQPKESQPKNAKRDPVFFLITHRPGQKVRNEVSTIIGYPFKKESLVKIAVDEKNFDLFTNGDGAWADTSNKDKQIVQTMKKGKTLSVKGTSLRGTQTTDTYSLEGLSAALEKIDAACK